MSEKLTISSESDLRSNLGIDETISFEIFRNPIQATKEELNKLKDEISKVSETFKKTEIINSFLKEKQDTIEQTKTDIGELLKTGGVAGVAGGAIKSLSDTLNEDDGKEGIEKVLSLGEKLTAWWDKITLSFQSLMWEKFPSLAKMFGIENPVGDIASQAAQTAKNLATQAREQETKIAERVKPGYNQYISIYFQIFRTSNEVSDDNLERNIESSLSGIIFEQQYFKDIKYNDLNTSKHIDKIYDAIQPSIPSRPELSNLSEGDIKKYIKIVLMSISGGNHTSSYPWYKLFAGKKEEKVERGNKLLISMYKKEGKNISQVNPSMFEIFDKLHSIGDFGGILGNGTGMDLKSIEDGIKGKAQTLLSNGISGIASMSQIDFDQVKGGLSEKLQNLGDFKDITTSILNTSESRSLGNNFQMPGLGDGFEQNEVLQTFIGNENEGLLKFGHDMYEGFFASGDLVWTTTKIPKDQVSLKKVYEIYLITGGKTNLSELSPMQKVNVTANLLASYGTAMDVGSSISDIINKVTSTDFKIDQDVKNILFSIGKYVVNASIDAASYMGKIWLGLSTEHKIYSLGLLFILAKAPIFTKRTSLI